MYRQAGGTVAEETQDRRYNFPNNRWFDQGGTRRTFPAELPFREYDPFAHCWRQGPHRLRNFRPNLYFTRPCDGKRTGTLGRLKDALTGEGPDVFVTISGDKRTLMRDRPQKWQWAGWGAPDREAYRYDKDWRQQDAMPLMGKMYNFRDRKFHRPKMWWYTNPNSDRVWTNAQWEDGARRSDMSPLNKELMSGLQMTKVPHWSGLGPRRAGGRERWS